MDSPFKFYLKMHSELQTAPQCLRPGLFVSTFLLLRTYATDQSPLSSASKIIKIN